MLLRGQRRSKRGPQWWGIPAPRNVSQYPLQLLHVAQSFQCLHPAHPPDSFVSLSTLIDLVALVWFSLLQSDLAKIETLRSVEDALLRAANPSSTETLDPAATLALTTKLLRLNPEHYTAWNALPNLWIIIKTIAWAVAIGAVREFFSSMHSASVLRRCVAVFLGHDPARPRVPSGPSEWEEWYNS
ncbi:LOW QUALITY PROTEIN: geranylgeranyl transferase type-2 subunit alpha [Colletotrichum tofieldiae]|nr:LOW QUALITY PROTEIN: geranylgeranyl transferase type-2 subunit alpha [Colletotrichum tofieldiae]